MRPKSLILGTDKDVLPVLLSVHCSQQSPSILDCTYNKGTMWKGLDYPITTMDIDPFFNTDYVGDCRKMPFMNASFDVVVFDPPHLPTNAASQNSSKIWEKRYGITDSINSGREGDNINALFTPFF